MASRITALLCILPSLITIVLGEGTLYAHCKVEASSGDTSKPITGMIILKQEMTKDYSPATEIKVDLSGFPTSNEVKKHGFHIHVQGNTGNACADMGGHFNPYGRNHGARTDTIRHVGDLGNIEVQPDGTVSTTIVDNMVKLTGMSSVIGRGIVIHSGEDDYSQPTGAAGSRLACCVITMDDKVSVDSISDGSKRPKSMRKAQCEIKADTGLTDEPIEGMITFLQPMGGGDTMVMVDVSGFDPNDEYLIHGFHVHKTGNMSNKCGATEGHYNPFNQNHGSPTDDVRHVGDLGNVMEDSEGRIQTVLIDDQVTLFGDSQVINRAVVIHQTADDLGVNTDQGSITTGNAGGRLGCCVIQLVEDGPANTAPHVSPLVAIWTSLVLGVFLNVMIHR